VVVVGSPGLGKSRLAAELTRRAKDVTTLWGRCLSYGDGITFWPLRDAAAEAPESEERSAFLEALEAETPPSAAEIGLAFRAVCETVARERPAIVVFDDLHWAEPTFLEAVEGLVDRAAGRILVVCLAREELLEERADFLEGRANAERQELEPLTAEETDALLDRLGGEVLESDQRTRILETAEGNPLFLEQLLALALEGGLGDRPFPATVQGLLAARLDRLGPGERAVLERGAVVGKEFIAADVLALLDPEAAPTLGTHLRVLSDRGFVRSRGDGAFAFRHVLVQDAVYRAAPKRLRAELHESFADRLDETYPELPELDELVGYHLEQAFRLRTELGEADRRAAQLAEDGGRRLGEAGIRALKRGDMPATVSLLRRATSLLSEETALRRELLCELAIGLRALQLSADAQYVLEEAMRISTHAADRRIELRARMEYEYLRLPRTRGASGDALLRVTTEAIPQFEVSGDVRSLGRAWLLSGSVKGARRGQHKAREEAAERALTYYEAANWPTSTCVGELAAALHYGPTPVHTAIARCEELLQGVSDRIGEANVRVFLGGLVAQRGDFDEARRLVLAARATFEELGHQPSVTLHAGTVLAEVELLSGDAPRAEQILVGVCDDLRRWRAYSHLASRAGDLAEALYSQGRVDEAEKCTRTAETYSAPDDVDARLLWLPVRAKVMALRGEMAQAEKLVRQAVRLGASSDGLNQRARVECDLAEVLRIGGRTDEAAVALRRARALYDQKGNDAGGARVASLLDVAPIA
jgi:tetratricopeptide (TPR) repeat protein